MVNSEVGTKSFEFRVWQAKSGSLNSKLLPCKVSRPGAHDQLRVADFNLYFMPLAIAHAIAGRLIGNRVERSQFCRYLCIQARHLIKSLDVVEPAASAIGENLQTRACGAVDSGNNRVGQGQSFRIA